MAMVTPTGDKSLFKISIITDPITQLKVRRNNHLKGFENIRKRIKNTIIANIKTPMVSGFVVISSLLVCLYNIIVFLLKG